MSQPWKPFIVAAAIIEHKGRFLLVEEREKDGKLTLNQPSGLLEPGESILEAVVRETREESTYEFIPTDFLGVYHLNYNFPNGEDISYIRFAFIGNIGKQFDLPLDNDIIRTVWMTYDEFKACPERHRSVVVGQCIEDYVNGIKAPLSVVSRYTYTKL